MVISLRGTNGAGKSTIVRAIMAEWESLMRIKVHWRRNPLGYLMTNGERQLFVPGHYEIANGGIDTLPDLDSAYDLIRQNAHARNDVLYEGKNMSDSSGRLIALSSTIGRENVHVIVIDIDVEECIRAVRERGHRIKEETIRAIHRRTIKQIGEFREVGIETHHLDRAAALEKVRSLLARQPALVV